MTAGPVLPLIQRVLVPGDQLRNTAWTAACRRADLQPEAHPASSSSALIAEHVFVHLREAGVQCEAIRCVDFDIAPGVEVNMGDSDQWPQIREKVIGADILLMATPTWMGHMSSVAAVPRRPMPGGCGCRGGNSQRRLAQRVAVAALCRGCGGARRAERLVFPVVQPSRR